MDSDSDGVNDFFDSDAPYPTGLGDQWLDPDGDGIPNIYDADSDNDGSIDSNGILPSGMTQEDLAGLLLESLENNPELEGSLGSIDLGDFHFGQSGVDLDGDGLITVGEVVGSLLEGLQESSLEYSSTWDDFNIEGATPSQLQQLREDMQDLATQMIAFVLTAIHSVPDMFPAKLLESIKEKALALQVGVSRIDIAVQINAADSGGYIQLAVPGGSSMFAKISKNAKGGISVIAYDEDGNEISLEQLEGDSKYEKFLALKSFQESTVADPIGTASGALNVVESDFVVPGRGLPVGLSRVYSSASTASGSFGPGWLSPGVDTVLVYFPALERMVVSWGDHTASTFELDPASKLYVGVGSEFGKVRFESLGSESETGECDLTRRDMTLVMRAPDGTKYYFCPPTITFDSASMVFCWLRKVQDSDGNAVVYRRNADGNAYQIHSTLSQMAASTDSNGTQQVDIEYDALGRAVMVSDWTGREWEYAYDPITGDLVSVTGPETFYADANGVVSTERPLSSYFYSECPEGFTAAPESPLNHNLGMVVRNGVTALEVEYYEDNGYSFDKVSSQIVDGHQTKFRYSALGTPGSPVDQVNPEADHLAEILYDNGTLERYFHQDSLLVRREVLNDTFDPNWMSTGGSYLDPYTSIPTGSWWTLYEYNESDLLVETLFTTDVLYPYGPRESLIYDSGNADRFQQSNLVQRVEAPFPPDTFQPERSSYYTYDAITCLPYEGVDPAGRVTRRWFAHNERAYTSLEEEVGIHGWGILPTQSSPEGQAMSARFGLGDLNQSGSIDQVGYGLIRIENPTVMAQDINGPGGGQQVIPTEYLVYGVFGEILSATGIDGTIESFYYSDGLVSESVQHFGADTVSVEYDRDALGRIVGIKYSDGREVLQGYDSLGNLLYSRQRAFQYIGEGGVGQETEDPTDDIITRVYYDLNGRVIARDNAVWLPPGSAAYPTGHVASNVLRYNYDSQDHLTSSVFRALDAQGNEHAEASGWYTYEYDCFGRKVREETANGHSIEYAYLPNGLLHSERALDAVGGVISETIHHYDPYLRPVGTVDIAGFETTFTTDGYGRVIGSEASTGVSVNIELNSDGQALSTEIAFNGSVIGRTESEYNSQGRATRTEVYNYVFDSSGVQPGAMVGAVDSYVRKFGWDAFGRLAWETPQGTSADGIVRYQYDDAGRLIRKVSGQLGEIAAEYEYTADGRIVSRSTRLDLHGSIGGQSPSVAQWVYSYDPHGRLNNTVLPDGEQINLDWDAAGRIYRRVAANGRQDIYSYDTLGNLLYSIEQGADGTRRDPRVDYSYNADAQTISHEDQQGSVTEYRYDSVGRLTETRYADGVVEYCTYNQEGELATVSIPGTGSRSFQYDSITGRISSISASTPNHTVSQSFQYDPFGRLVRSTDQIDSADIVANEYSYDSIGTLLSQSIQVGANFSAAVQVQLTADGRIGEYVLPSGRVCSVHRDSLGRVSQMDLDGVEFVRYPDPYGSKIERRAVFRGGYELDRQYDPNGRMIRTTLGSSSGAPLLDRSVGYDSVGNVGGIVDAISGDEQHSHYDQFDRLIAWEVTDSQGVSLRNETWLWNAANALLKHSVNGAENGPSAPNSVNQLSSLAPKFNNFEFSADGGLIGANSDQGEIEIEWDGLGRPIRVAMLEPGNSPRISNILYSADGNVASIDGPAGEHFFAYFAGALQGQYFSNGSYVEYLYASDGVSPVATVRQDGAMSFRISDGQGGVYGELDESGTFSEREYSPFGTCLDSSWADGDGFGTGTLGYKNGLDVGELGLTFFGARLYLPGTCSFISRDPAGTSGGLNLYGFARSNPQRWSDPTGNKPQDNQSPGMADSVSRHDGNVFAVWSELIYMDDYWIPLVAYGSMVHDFGHSGDEFVDEDGEFLGFEAIFESNPQAAKDLLDSYLMYNWPDDSALSGSFESLSDNFGHDISEANFALGRWAKAGSDAIAANQFRASLVNVALNPVEVSVDLVGTEILDVFLSRETAEQYAGAIAKVAQAGFDIGSGYGEAKAGVKLVVGGVRIAAKAAVKKAVVPKTLKGLSGIYEFSVYEGGNIVKYVGRSKNIGRRLSQHLKDTNKEMVDGTVRYWEVGGIRTDLEIVEQQRILFHGGVDSLANKYNSIGSARAHLLEGVKEHDWGGGKWAQVEYK